MSKSNKYRINAFISKNNYNKVTELMNNEELMCMKLSKGAILDLALTNLFNSLAVGETLENIAIQHLEKVGDS